MSYYGARGDFYTGRTGYYRGDPGFFSNVFRGIGGAVKGYLTGGVGGAVSGLVGGFSGGGSPPPQPTISAAGSAGLGLMGPRGTAVGVRPSMGGRITGAALTLPRIGAAAVPGVTTARAPMGGVRGHRLSHLAKYGVRKRPAMNVANPRALRRAIRRAKGFEKLAMRSIRLVNPRRLHGKRWGGFKTSRRRK